MPEGHTVRRLALDHDRMFAGHAVRVSSPQGRFVGEASRLDGRVFRGADAWGKHLWHRYDGDLAVHVHLGLYGAFTPFRFDETGPGEPVGQVRMRLVGHGVGIDLRGPTDCSLVTEEQIDAVLARLGPDPLRDGTDPDAAWHRIGRSRRAIGALLMDQKVIAGVGNVYRAEVLFRAHIDPHREGRAVRREEFDGVWTDLVALMPIGVEKGRMHVVRPEHDHGAPAYGKNRPRTYVYRRAGEACRVCGTTIRAESMEGRTVYWCPGCQV